jgi:hypothetical protein
MKYVGQFAFASVCVWASTACAFDGEIAFKGISVSQPLKYAVCGPTDFGNEPIPECPVRAIEIGDTSNNEKDKFLPIDLKCPDENGGVLELVSENKGGNYQRLIVIYNDGKPSSAYVSYSTNGLNYTTTASADIQSPKTESESGTGRGLSIVGETIRIKVCNAGASARQNYLEKYSK